MIGPAPILAAIVGLFHVSAYIFIRGRVGARFPFLLLAAVLGAWAGDTVGARMGIDPLRIGEFHVLTASFVAWLGIGLVAILAVLIPERQAGPNRRPITTSVHRGGGTPGATSNAPTPTSAAAPAADASTGAPS